MYEHDSLMVPQQRWWEAIRHFRRESNEIEMIVRHGFPIDSRVAKTGDTALHIACSRGNVHLAIKLLSLNANINCQNLNGTTALMKASKNGHIETVRYLLGTKDRSADIDRTNNNGDTALLMSLRYNFENVAMELIAAGACVGITNEAGEYGITIAARRGSANLCKMLLHLPDNYLEQNIGQFDPLLLAVKHNENTEVVRILAQAGFMVTETHISAANDRPYLAKQIINELTAASVGGVHLKNTLLNASTAGDAHAVRTLFSGMPALIVKTVINSTTNSSGTPPIVLASRTNSRDCAKCLIGFGANPDISDSSNGLTCMHLFAKQGDEISVELLLRCGANPNIQDSLNYTPLMYAIEQSHFPVVNVLLHFQAAHPVNVDLVNHAGDTSLHIALRKHDTRSVGLLLSRDKVTKISYLGMQNNLQEQITQLQQQLIQHKRSVFLARKNKEAAITSANEHVRKLETVVHDFRKLVEFFLYERKRLRLDDTKKYLEILELGIDFKTKENKKKANIMDHFDKYVKALGEIITKPFCLHDLIVPEENPEF